MDSKMWGLSVPNLTYYNLASVLEPIYILCHFPNDYRWSTLIGVRFFLWGIWGKDLLLATYLWAPTPTFELLCLSHLFDVWLRYVLRNGGMHLIRDMLPLTILYGWTKTIPLHLWESHCVSRLGLLYNGETFPSFSEISGTFNLPKMFFFQYLQIHHILQRCNWCPVSPHFSSFHKFLMGTTGLNKGVYTLYSYFLTMQPQDRPEHVLKWERELGSTYCTLIICGPEPLLLHPGPLNVLTTWNYLAKLFSGGISHQSEYSTCRPPHLKTAGDHAVRLVLCYTCGGFAPLLPLSGPIFLTSYSWPSCARFKSRGHPISSLQRG